MESWTEETDGARGTFRESDLGLERKAVVETIGGTDDLIGLFEEHMRVFEAFKAANDARLDEMQRATGPDPLTEQKLAKIEGTLKTLDQQLMHLSRPSVRGTPVDDDDDDERKAALETYVRKGRTDGFDLIESKGLFVGSEADGGYVVYPQLDERLHTALRADSPMRQLASILTISTAAYKRPFAVSGAGSGWVAETAARPETATPQIAELNFPAMELYAAPVATKQLLDDSIVDIEAWLVDELNAAFSEQESGAYITGDGTAMPMGLLSYPLEPAETAAFGQVGTVSTGTDGDFDADDPAGSLIELVHSLPARYRKNGSFLMSRMTLSAVRRLRSAGGDYLFQAQLADGFKMTLLGFPVVEYDDMPDIGPGTPAIAFADFKRAYLIVDRQGVQILRDPYSAKPYVLFYATKRVGGGISDFNAIRVLRFGV